MSSPFNYTCHAKQDLDTTCRVDFIIEDVLFKAMEYIEGFEPEWTTALSIAGSLDFFGAGFITANRTEYWFDSIGEAQMAMCKYLSDPDVSGSALLYSIKRKDGWYSGYTSYVTRSLRPDL